MRRPLAFGTVILATLGALGMAQAATQIGVTSAVVPAARGTPPSAEPRVLKVGLDMQANERVQTDAEGKAQLLFLDGSALSIGPNSEVLLDEYIYDPDTRTGKIALSASRGVFRLVGGAISKTTPVTIKTPIATIGIRGGIAAVSVGATVTASFLFGSEMTVTGGGVMQRVERAGFQVTTGADGAPNAPTPLTEQALAGQNAAFEGGGGAPAGGVQVTDEDVASSQVSDVNSVAGLGAIAPAAGGAPPPPPAPPTEVVTDSRPSPSVGLDDGPDETPTDGQPPLEQSPPAPPSLLTIAALFSGGAKHATNPAIGTDDGNILNDIEFSGGTIANGIFDAPVGSGRFTAPIQDGTFAVTTMAQPFGPAPLSGTGLFAPDRDFAVYELTDTGDGHKVLVFAGAPTPLAAFPASGASFFRLRRDFVLDSGIPFVNRASGGDVLDGLPESTEANAAIYWDVSGSPTAQRPFAGGVVAILGQGAAQKSAAGLLVGEVDFHGGQAPPSIEALMRGSSRVMPNELAHFFSAEARTADDGLGNDFFGSNAPKYFVLDAGGGGVSDFKPDVEFPTIFNPNVAALPAAALLDPRTGRTINGYSAGVSRFFDGPFDDLSIDTSTVWNDANPLDIEITTDAATNKLGARFEVEELCCFSPTIVVRFGDLDGAAPSTSGRSAFIDDGAFAAVERSPALFTPTLDGSPSSAEIYVVTAADGLFVSDGLVPAGVQLYEPQYAVWGFWGGRIERNSNGDFVLAHLVPWAAGPITNIATIQQLIGSATYTGHVIGQVLTGGQIYHAVGGLTLNADFAQQKITGGAITNYDGGDYNVTLGPTFSSVSSLNIFHAGLTGVSGTAVGRSGSLDGSFVQGGGNPVAETIGHFEASGSGYETAGVAVGRMTGGNVSIGPQ